MVAAEVPEVPGLIGIRDPFVFTYGGKRWGIQGAGVREGGRFVPTLLLFLVPGVRDFRDPRRGPLYGEGRPSAVPGQTSVR